MRLNARVKIFGVLSSSLIFITLHPTAFGASTELANLDYPELMVVPKASERLAAEAKEESQSAHTRLIPMQLSAAFTLASGLMGSSATPPTPVGGTAPSSASASMIATGVGAGWLVTSVLLNMKYTPYSDAAAKVAAMPKGSKREQLLAERYAEEVINSAASLGNRLMWLSVITNSGASFYLATSSFGSSLTSGSAVGIAMGSAVIGLVPLLFKTRWQKVGNLQHDYKKRIYGTLSANPTMLKDPSGQNFVPGFSLALNF